MSGGSTAPLLQCRGLNASHGRIRVVFDLDLDVAAGEVLAVLGPNGAGKSSLLGAMAGTVRSAGTVALRGRELQGLTASRRAGTGLALVPEQRRNIFPTMTVWENLAVGMRLSPAAERAAILDSVLDLLPILRQRMRSAASVLSGGEQQMLAIGMALGRRPALLMLDEPSQGLAPAIFDVLEDAVATLRARGMGILLAEQNLAFAARLADRFIVLSQGRTHGAGGRDALRDYGSIPSLYFPEAGGPPPDTQQSTGG